MKNPITAFAMWRVNRQKEAEAKRIEKAQAYTKKRDALLEDLRGLRAYFEKAGVKSVNVVQWHKDLSFAQCHLVAANGTIYKLRTFQDSGYLLDELEKE